MAPERSGRVNRPCTDRVLVPRDRRSGEAKQSVVLVVDNDPQGRKLVTRLLEKAGHSVLAAADGHEGLFISRRYSGPIDLLIADVRTSRLDGTDLSAHLLRERPGMKVIFSISERLSEFFAAGGQLPFLTKPISARALSEKVQQVLRASDATTQPQSPSAMLNDPGGRDQQAL